MKRKSGQLAIHDLAERFTAKVAVDLYARDAIPGDVGELVNRYGAPLVKGKTCDIAESNACLWVVLADVPGAGSGDIEKFGDEYRVASTVLAVQRIALGEGGNPGKKLGLGHGL